MVHWEPELASVSPGNCCGYRERSTDSPWGLRNCSHMHYLQLLGTLFEILPKNGEEIEPRDGKGGEGETETERDRHRHMQRK